MLFPPDFLDEIRARLPVSQVVGRAVKLRRQGREYVGLSPFKAEKTPSFTVNDAKGFYHCFATSEHGDIFTFLMKVEGLSFPDAVERLAGEAGVQMPRRTPADTQREDEHARLRRICEASAAFFVAQLAAPAGGKARATLAQRGVAPEVAAQFRLGYAPAGRAALKQHLAGLGFSADDAARAGMLIAGDDIPVSYDRFRDRLIFPITDRRGAVIAFGGRALAPDVQPKYLNSPETPLFHKGGCLYNLAAARQPAHQRGTMIVAEGYMDVIALARAGHANAVAPLGTALTETQLAMLWAICDEPLLCFDGDAAGQKAAARAIDLALPALTPAKSLNFVFLPDGKDPDDVLREAGAEALGALIEAHQPLIDMLWRRELAAGDWSTPERRAALERRCETLAGGIADRAVRQHYLAALRERLRAAFGARPAMPARTAKPAWRPLPAGTRRPPPTPAELRTAPGQSLVASALSSGDGTAMPLRELLMLAALLTHPWLLAEDVEAVAALPFESAPLSAMRDALLQAPAGQDRAALERHLAAAGHGGVLARLTTLAQPSDRRLLPSAPPAEALLSGKTDGEVADSA